MTTSRRLSVGDAAPDLALADGAGEPVQLSALWGGRPLLLVFLRHYG
jgi:peroxiredoxin